MLCLLAHTLTGEAKGLSLFHNIHQPDRVSPKFVRATSSSEPTSTHIIVFTPNDRITSPEKKE